MFLKIRLYLRMMKSLTLLLSLVFANFAVLAQNKFTLSGFVLEDKSGEKLNNVSISIDELADGGSTNAYGFYSLTLPKGSYTINFTRIGYITVTEKVELTENKKLTIRLKNKTTGIAEIKVNGRKKAPIQQTTQVSVNSLPMSQIKALPAIFGEVDILKSLQLLPGVQGGTEGSAGIYVRGGSADQNLFLLDGVPVYNVNHLGGFFSTFNADAISNVDLYKGGFPARFGGRLSSVVDIKMKEGSNKDFHAEGGIGIISSKLLLEGPLKKKKGSFLLSGRRTYVDALIAPIVKAQSQGASKAGYFFYDFNAKLNYELSPKDHIYLSGYFGRDKFYFANTDTYDQGSNTVDGGLNWGNATGVARWNHVFSNKVFGNLSTSYTSYDYRVIANVSSIDNNDTTIFGANVFSGINDVAVKYDVDILPNTNHTIKTGIGYTRHSFTPSVTNIKVQGGGAGIDTSVNAEKIKADEIDIYAEDDWKISSKLKVNVGFHIAGFNVRNTFYTGFQPRLSMRYLINDNYSFKASYTRMNQFINLLSFDGAGLPSDLWVPVTDKIKPQNSNQIAGGLFGTLNKMYEVSLEGYYKNLTNVIDYKDGSSYINTTGTYEDIVEMGIGRCYGSEFLLQKKEGKLQGLISYGLAWSQRKYPTINRGEWFYYRYDRRHDFKIAAIYKVGKRTEFSGNFIFNTGSWNTIPTLRYNPVVPSPSALGWVNLNQPYYYYPSRNNYNMINTHRLDLGMRWSRKAFKKYEVSYAVGVYNTYGRKNPFFIILGSDDKGNPAFQQTSLFGFPLPYFTFNWKI